MATRLTARYRVRAETGAIEQRARDIAVEQSIEMPVSAVRNAFVLSDVVGEVTRIVEGDSGWFEVDIGLAVSTIEADGGQLLNMLYGNTSLHDDVALVDFEAPPEWLRRFAGPNKGLEGLRKMSGARGRALTCSALKPQGLSADALAEIAFEFARGGVDFIKDDHGLANQSFSPFESRVRACARQIQGKPACWVGVRADGRRESSLARSMPCHAFSYRHLPTAQAHSSSARGVCTRWFHVNEANQQQLR